MIETLEYNKQYIILIEFLKIYRYILIYNIMCIYFT